MRISYDLNLGVLLRINMPSAILVSEHVFGTTNIRFEEMLQYYAIGFFNYVMELGISSSLDEKNESVKAYFLNCWVYTEAVLRIVQTMKNGIFR